MKKADSAQFIVTIDGPAGSGKTTVSRILADHLGFDYVDTGALYRAIALTAVSQKVALDDDAALARMCDDLSIRIVRQKDGMHLVLNGCDVIDRIRTPEISMAASTVSARPVVRKYLLDLQRDLGRGKRAVFEGRDMGTVVFPEADVKFFIDADLDTRAGRRYRELKNRSPMGLNQVREDISRRDENDSSRAVAPLKAAVDAIRIDTTGFSVSQVVDLLYKHVVRVIF